MADFLVSLQPTANKDGDTEQMKFQIADVEVGWNQIGWLIFQNDKREIVAGFQPGQVQFMLRTDNNQGISEVIDTTAEEVDLVN